jgi:hypothetical protein
VVSPLEGTVQAEDLRIRVLRAGVIMALLSLPPLVPVDELSQVGCFLCVAYDKLVLQ